MGPNSTFLKFFLNLFILLDERYLKVGQSCHFGFLTKIIIPPKVGERDHFCGPKSNTFERFTKYFHYIKKWGKKLFRIFLDNPYYASPQKNTF